MARYTSSVNGIAHSAQMRAFPAAAITVQGGSFRLFEAYLAGEAASSNNFRVGLNRPSANGTSSGTQTAEKKHPAHPAAGVVPVIAWSVNPTATTNDVGFIAFNGFGGAVRWTAPVDGEIWVVAGVAQGNLLVTSRNGSGNVSGNFEWEEF